MTGSGSEYRGQFMASIVPTIVSQHAEEASFLWLLRDFAVLSPHYSLSDLSELDDRVEAHLDGLRIAAGPGWDICKEELAWEEPGEIFAAAVLAFESGDDARIEEVLAAGTTTYDLSRGLISALGWIDAQAAGRHIRTLLESGDSSMVRIGIRASAVRRQDPGKDLDLALSVSDPPLLAAALRAAGELGRSDLFEVVVRHLPSTDPACVFWAAWTAAFLREDAALDVLVRAAESPGPYSGPACDLAARWMHPEDALDWHREMAGDTDGICGAIRIAGALGDPALLPWLIETMAVEEHARRAGEAFTMITGIDLADEDLEGEPPEAFQAGPSESPGEDETDLDPDEDLPWPDRELLGGWWKDNETSYATGSRYLFGHRIGDENLTTVLLQGCQRHRLAAALELALDDPREGVFEIRAPGFRQEKMLA